MSKANVSFADWFEKNARFGDLESGEEDVSSGEQSISFLLQFNSIQDSVTSQLSELGAIDMGAAFRTRITHAIYLLIAAVAFSGLAIVVGLPTIVLRPAKFVVLITLSTICAAGSVIVMQTPAAFIANFLKADPKKQGSVIALTLSLLFTLYAAIFVHTYACVLFAGSIQVMAVLYYLSSFIPGGTKGLTVLLKTGFMLVKTTMQPCLFVAKKTTRMVVKRLFS